MAKSGSDNSPQSCRTSTAPSPEYGDGKTSNRTTAIRVSRACVQCRSKHVKCDGTMPTCKRCLAEGKPCFFAKSRRGIRDPKERSLISDKPPALRFDTRLLHVPTSFSLDVGSSPHSSDAFSSGLSCEGILPPGSSDQILLTAYYTYFHPSHSMMLPKFHFLRYVELDPDSMHFLLSAVKYIGSLYTSRAQCEELREVAFTAACGPLPMTAQSVLGLIILSIAALGEMKFDYQNGWINRAISMALEIGMQKKAFADSTEDPILAESHRRVYWGLHLLDCMRTIRDPEDKMLLHEHDSDVDLPCEEWEYDAGQIPQPISLIDYDLQNSLGPAEFSSWAYLVDICRISGKLILPYDDILDAKNVELFERADTLICDWMIKVPQWKKDLVDSGGVADMMLFHAITFAQQNRLMIRQCASRQGLNLRQTFPLGPARGPHRQAHKIKSFGWNAIPIDIQAANSICGLFRQSFPTKNLSPLCLPGLLRVALAYMDACVFLGLDTPAYREKLHMLLRIMTAHGGTWAISQNIAEEVRQVAKDYSLLPQSVEQNPSGDDWMHSLISSTIADDITLAEFDFAACPNFGGFHDWINGSRENSA